MKLVDVKILVWFFIFGVRDLANEGGWNYVVVCGSILLVALQNKLIEEQILQLYSVGIDVSI